MLKSENVLLFFYLSQKIFAEIPRFKTFGIAYKQPNIKQLYLYV